MKAIQFILLGLLVLLFTYVINKLKNRWIDLLVISSLIITGAVFIIFPDLTIIIAHKLGVGRGADLVFYLSILIFWFVIIKLYARIRKLEQIMTDIIRKDALKNVSKGGPQ
jgi:Uncharacterized conserved protein